MEGCGKCRPTGIRHPDRLSRSLPVCRPLFFFIKTDNSDYMNYTCIILLFVTGTDNTCASTRESYLLAVCETPQHSLLLCRHSLRSGGYRTQCSEEHLHPISSTQPNNYLTNKTAMTATFVLVQVVSQGLQINCCEQFIQLQRCS
jgi:hypothetical protein